MFRSFCTKWVPLVACIILFFSVLFWIVPVVVKGDSMVPTLFENQRIFVLKKSELSRFDIIIFKDPESENPLIKRIIGLPGERIRYEKDQLFVGDEKINEPFLKELVISLAADTKLTEDIPEQRIPENTYFVLGDNRKISRDSRMFGVIKKEEIIGEAKLSFWPLNQIEQLP